MKLTAYDKRKLGNLDGCYGKTKMFGVLDEFANSEMTCAKLEDWPHKSATSCQASLVKSIKRYGFNIKVITRKGEVFLLKTIDIESTK